MIFSAKQTNFRQEYRQVSRLRWAWVTVVDVSVPDLELTTTIVLPDKTAAVDVTSFLTHSQELLKLARQASDRLSSTTFQLTVTEDDIK